MVRYQEPEREHAARRHDAKDDPGQPLRRGALRQPEGGDGRPDGGRRHQPAEIGRPAGIHRAGHARQQLKQRFEPDRQRGQQQQNRTEPCMTRRVAHALGRLPQEISRAALAPLVANHPDLEQAAEKDRKSDAVDQKRHAGADRREQESGNRRPDKSGNIEHRRIHGDGGGHDVALQQIGHHGQPGRRVKCPDAANKEVEPDQCPDRDVAAKGQRGQGKGLQHAEKLRRKHHLVAIDPVGDDTGDRCQDHRREQIGEGDDAEAINANGQPLRPDADQRDKRAPDIPAEIGVTERGANAMKTGEQGHLRLRRRRTAARG